jgi:hypothetical protein
MNQVQSWLVRVAGATLLVACLSVAPARAEDRLVAALPAPATYENADDYTIVLLSSYVAAPLLGTGLTLTISGLDEGGVTPLSAAIGFGSALFVPATVHWLSGERRLAARAFFGWPVAMLAGGLSVGLVAILTVAIFDPFEGRDGGGPGNGFVIAAGAAIGAGMAAIAFPIFDIIDTHARRAHKRVHSAPPLTFSVAPLPRGGAVGLLRGAL